MKTGTTSYKKTLQVAGISAFFILILTYAFFGSEDLILGVKVRDVKIGGLAAQPEMKIDESAVSVTGNAKHAIHLELNGREITINEAGDFNETIALLPGYNVINITAKDKFGYTDEKNYKLMH